MGCSKLLGAKAKAKAPDQVCRDYNGMNPELTYGTKTNTWGVSPRASHPWLLPPIGMKQLNAFTSYGDETNTYLPEWVLSDSRSLSPTPFREKGKPEQVCAVPLILNCGSRKRSAALIGLWLTFTFPNVTNERVSQSIVCPPTNLDFRYLTVHNLF
ncbi:hypothetical protein OPV22_017263 [Ensete ventricosum]|uniref:Uncharacterized protein n=1 Tax=Ensete ventricosum TaxID=4639 RepID=A0AAV8QVY8_ENSVE|nr:hypothetical protein OPV22_017263 [Ensete ventricosum]